MLKERSEKENEERNLETNQHNRGIFIYIIYLRIIYKKGYAKVKKEKTYLAL